MVYTKGTPVTVRTGKKVWTVLADWGGPSLVIVTKLSPGYSNTTTRVVLRSDVHPLD
jgi:hypothetical protein